MAPARKKSVNKRFLNEVSPDKELRNSNKIKEGVNGKRRYSDALGPQWSKEELRRFYKAYRVHGVDLKKIAAGLPNRTVEMVRALYVMNKAYLSLPEGMASIVGFIAMMTDHYTTLEVSDSERESNDVPEMPRKYKRAKVKRTASSEDLQSHSITSTGGYLSLLKKGNFYGGQPRAVGKRTPRIAISRESRVSMKKKDQKFEYDVNEDEVAHVAALALTEASQKGGHPQVSLSLSRRTDNIKSSPLRSWDILSKSSHTKLHGASIYGQWMEGGLRKGADNGAHAKDMRTMLDMEVVGTVEVNQKGKKFYGKRVKVEENGNSHFDDGGEACSGTEEGAKASAIRKRVDIEDSNAEIDETSPQALKKRGDNNFSGDEFSALDALHALANISVMESESSAQLNEERSSLNVDDKFSIHEATSASHHQDKIKLLGRKERVLNLTTEVEHTASRKSKLGSQLAINSKPVFETKPLPLSNTSNANALKRKRQSMASKVPNGEAPINAQLSKSLETEVDGEEIISALKIKRTDQISAVSKQVKAVGLSESFLGADQKTSDSEVKPTANIPISSQIALPTKRTSRRKMGLKQEYISKEGISSKNILKNQSHRCFTSVQDTALHLKEKLSCSLSSPMVRRWCTFEWFYSAIDYPWFAKREFVEYLNHVGLGQMPRLTRVEWGVIRSSLGKPRRFSEHFLLEEREKLKLYRDSVRKHYTELRTGIREGLPTDLARPLTVGQLVIAVHPKTRELKDGSVLTVDNDRCRVQFDCPEMGVEFVKDIDCMPLNPVYNMPEVLRKQRCSVTSKGPQVNGQSIIGGCTSARHFENSQAPTNMLVKQVQGFTNYPQAKAASIDITNAQEIAYTPSFASTLSQAKEADEQVVLELNRAFDKASSALPNLRPHDTYPGNALPTLLKPPVNCTFPGGVPSSHHSFVSQESGSTVVEIVRNSRHRAQTMIDAAVQAFSFTKEGEDAFRKIGEAIDSIDRTQVTSESKAQVIRSPEQCNSILHHKKSLEPPVIDNEPRPKSHSNGDKIESAIPSELITSCLATFLMIQTCTERQYPPADVAQIIDSAVTSLHPCCPQNLPIYREIQMCMGRIKTQILALIPT